MCKFNGADVLAFTVAVSSRPCIWDNGIWIHYRVIVRVKMGHVYTRSLPKHYLFALRNCPLIVAQQKENHGPRSRKSDNEHEQRRSKKAERGGGGGKESSGDIITDTMCQASGRCGEARWIKKGWEIRISNIRKRDIKSARVRLEQKLTYRYQLPACLSFATINSKLDSSHFRDE